MDRQTKNGQIGHRRGGIFTVLAWFLFVVTVVGLIARCCSGSGPEKALAKTRKAVQEREKDVLFLLSAVSDGSVTLSGEELSVAWNAALSDGGYTLTAKEGKNRISLYAADDRLTAAGSLFPDGSVYASREGAAYALGGGALDQEGVSSRHYAFFQFLLSLSDPALTDSETFASALGRIVKKAKPAVTAESGDFRDGKTRLDVTCYRYRLDSEALVRALSALLKEGQDEEFRRSVTARYALVLSLCGKKLNPSDEKAILSFLEGKGKTFDAVSNRLGKSDSYFELCLSVYNGALIAVNAEAEIGEYRQSGELFLGADPGTAKHARFRFSLDREEENRMKLEFSHQIMDDSEAAFIREWSWSVSDRTGVFGEDGTETKGSARFSWGRTKGDLGLKWNRGEESLVLRGTLLSRKEEKEICVRLNRVEENGTNILPCDAVEITVDRSPSLEEAPGAKKKMFPDGEEKETLAAAFREAYNTLFGGETA